MKAILVIDMPTECIECEFCRVFKDNKAKETSCTLTALRNEDGINTIAEWCPLRPLPKRKEVDKYVAFDLINASTVYTDLISCNVGWNACLREIEEKQNEERGV